MIKRAITFSCLAEVQKHAKENFLQLIVYKNVVYDVTDFVYTHPGGSSVIQQHTNSIVDDVLFNPDHHKHSPQIIIKLESMRYGFLEKEFTSVIQQEVKFTKKVGNTRRFLAFEAEHEPSSLKQISSPGRVASSPQRIHQSATVIRGSSIDTDRIEEDIISNLKVPFFMGVLESFHKKKPK